MPAIEPKTRSLGTVAITKFAKHAEWKAYAEATAKFQDAKANLNVAKGKMKEMLKKHSATLAGVENLDFAIAPNKKELAVFEKLQAGPRTASSKEIDFE